MLLALSIFTLSNLASAQLVDRGYGMIYDTALNITWLQDAGLGGNHEHDGALTQAEDLIFGSFCNWRLPSSAELSHMYSTNLGGTTGDNLTGDQGPFLNIQPVYWSSSGNRVGPVVFDFTTGSSMTIPGDSVPGTVFSVWAVKSGDVQPNGGISSPTHFQIYTPLVSGWIDTDGTVGALQEENIIDWNLTLRFTDSFGDYFYFGLHKDLPSQVWISGISAI